MKVEVLDDVHAVAQRAAALIGEAARAAVEARGRFTVATSGGRTPWAMLRALNASPGLPWRQMHILQVDERIAPLHHAERNFTHLCASLAAPGEPGRAQIYAMPVESPELDEAAERYARTLANLAGWPPTLDLVHLGLGPDGHTASLVPDDPALAVTDADVAVTNDYQGRRRMTLTYPALNRARQVLWVVTGEEKATMLERLLAGDPTIPAGRIRQEHALVLADRAAAGPSGR